MSKFQPQKVRQISYLKDFKCAAASCVDSCCVGWIINVTPENAEFYRKENSEIVKSLEPYGEKEFQIKRCGNGACSQLENDLCKIQKNFGEEYLPDVCFTFPRSYKKIAGDVYMSANLACPESLKVALFNNKKDDFVDWNLVEQTRTKSDLFNYQLKNISDFESDKIINVFRSMIQVIDDKNYDSDWSLARLLLMAAMIDQKFDFNVGQIVKTEIAEISDKKFSEISLRDELFTVLKAMFVLTKIDRPRYHKAISAVRECLGDCDSNEEELIKNYEVICNFWDDSKNKFDQILKNLIKAKLSYLGFVVNSNNKYNAVSAVALEYLVVKLALMCWNYKLKRDLSVEEIIDIIQPLTKRFYSLKSKNFEDFCSESHWYDFGKAITVVVNFS